MSELLAKIRRGLKKPPRYLAERAVQELRGQTERFMAPRRAQRLRPDTLARLMGFADVDAWWAALAKRPFVAATHIDRAAFDRLCPGDAATIAVSADRAAAREIDLLGSGPVRLGTPIDWSKDYKTGHRWPPAYCRDIEYNNLDTPSDVKFPWEISRMQWLMPAAQAYALTGEARHAAAVRDVIDEWIAANPYAMSVNWSCTMDVAIRLMTWTWFFHVLHASPAWSDTDFRGRFLQSLYLHADFTARNLEASDINGNHYTADAAGLVFAGLFFGGGGDSEDWSRLGWQILSDELPRQVYPDGVDFEASLPYHRLVQELFLLPALYRLKIGLEVPAGYRERMIAMARFTAAYSRPDGGVPLWGDADDARALPFRTAPINDHRYLLALAGLGLGAPSLIEQFSGPRSELVWLFGTEAASALPVRDAPPAAAQHSAAFRDGGFYVLRNDRDHVFVDCGPLGLGGRGGHGHNDLLSFEAALDGVHLVSDCGAYLYTASMAERNNFRSTAYHNTPRVDAEEINRFVRPDYLWSLRNDARHETIDVVLAGQHDRLILGHNGYQRLAHPVTVRRTFDLDHSAHALAISDVLTGDGAHEVEIPIHFAPGVTCRLLAAPGRAVVAASGRQFDVTWSDAAEWDVAVEPARVSPSYGVVRSTHRLMWRRRGALRPLQVALRPHTPDAA